MTTTKNLTAFELQMKISELVAALDRTRGPQYTAMATEIKKVLRTYKARLKAAELREAKELTEGWDQR